MPPALLFELSHDEVPEGATVFPTLHFGMERYMADLLQHIGPSLRRRQVLALELRLDDHAGLMDLARGDWREAVPEPEAQAEVERTVQAWCGALPGMASGSWAWVMLNLLAAASPIRALPFSP